MHEQPIDPYADHTPETFSQRRALLAGIGGLAAGVIFAGKAQAGPLSPPAGPVAPTPGPEPRVAINATNTPGIADSLYRITQSGSYYLTGNIVGVAGKHGIEIAASGVTLDLNGFDLIGMTGMGAFDGVRTGASGLINISILNGSVRNWGGSGVNLGSLSAFNCRVESVLASGNGVYGIRTGSGGGISNCASYTNAFNGMEVGQGSTVSNSTAHNNTGRGILTSTGSIVSGCTAFSNTSAGIQTSNTGCIVSGCIAYNNQGNGITINSGSTVVDCIVRFNAGDGIQASSNSVIRNNSCSSNGFNGDGAGIHTTGGGNRIEDNNCTVSDRGIDVDTSGNFIVRNTCAGNTTNWDIAAFNVCFVVDSTASPAFSGNSGGTSPGSSNPNANYTY